jgi:hypothetical protein
MAVAYEEMLAEFRSASARHTRIVTQSSPRACSPEWSKPSGWEHDRRELRPP